MTIPVRALSVARPWAELIMTGLKPVENRTWSTRYRGLLVIHASKRWDQFGAEIAADVNVSVDPATHPTGYLGCVDLVGMHHASECGGCSLWAEPECWHWRVIGPRRFRQSIAGPGRLGLYVPPATVVGLAGSHGGTNR